MGADDVAVGALGGGADDRVRARPRVAAPQWIGRAPNPPRCEVRRMWPSGIGALSSAVMLIPCREARLRRGAVENRQHTHFPRGLPRVNNLSQCFR